MSFLITLVLLIAIVIWLLSIPVRLIVAVNTDAADKLQLRTLWFYGLVDFKSSNHKSPGRENSTRKELSKTHVAEKKERKKEKKRKKRQSKRNKDGDNGTRFIYAMIRSEGFLKRFVKFIVDCFKAVQFSHTHISAKIGLGDPADTGQAVAMLAPIFVFLRLGPVPTASLEADYYQSTFHLSATTTIRIVPLDYFRLFCSLLFSPTLWRGIKAGLAAKLK